MNLFLLCVPVETQKPGGKALSSLVSATADLDSHTMAAQKDVLQRGPVKLVKVDALTC